MSATDTRILAGIMLALVGSVTALKGLEYALIGSAWWIFDPRSVVPLFFIHRLVAPEATPGSNRWLIALAGPATAAYVATLLTVSMAAIVTFLWCVGVLGFLGLRTPECRRRMLYAVPLALLVPISHQIALSGQHLTTLHELTFDLAAYRIDAALGGNPVALFSALDLGSAMARLPLRGLEIVYATLSIPIGILLIEQARSGGPDWMVTVIGLFGAGLIGACVYEYYPIAGPRYLFTGYIDGTATAAYPDPAGVALALSPLSTEWPRNGMPSLHVTWAFLAFLNACRLSRAMGWVCGGYFVATALATIALGHHYIIDLIVAMPFGLAVQAMARFTLALRAPARRDALLAGISLTAAWLLMLRFIPEFLVALPVTMPLLALATVAITAVLTARLALARELASEAAPARLVTAISVPRA
jgi:hypothetical protein